MIYITELMLNTRSDIIRNPGILHSYIAQAIGIPVTAGEVRNQEKRRYLWRIDIPTPAPAQANRNGQQTGKQYTQRPSATAIPAGPRRLIIVSDTKPAMGNLIRSCGDGSLPFDKVMKCRDYTGDLNSYAIDTEYEFRLTANPTKSIHADDTRSRGTVHGINKFRDQMEWLRTQGDKHGFKVLYGSRVEFTTVHRFDGRHPDARQNNNRHQSGRPPKPTNHPNGPVQFRTCTFVGRLVVTDPEKFRDAMVNGIGPCKAYGQGLMTLKPLSQKEMNRV